MYKKIPLWIFSLLFLFIGLIVVPHMISAYNIGFLIAIFVNIVLAESWGLFSGYCGYVLLGSAAFYGIGAYVSAIFSNTLPFTLNILLAGVICGGVAAILGLPILRVRGVYFLIMTFALSEVIKNLIKWYEVVYSVTMGRIVLTQPPITVYYAALVIAAITVASSYLIRKSKFGVGLICISDDEDAAESIGVNTTIYKLLAFVICTMFMGFAGATMVARIGYVDPDSAFAPSISFQVLVMALLGGPKRVLGPVVGAVVLTTIQLLFAATQLPYHFGIILGALVIALVLFPSRLIDVIKKSFSSFYGKTLKPIHESSS